MAPSKTQTACCPCILCAQATRIYCCGCMGIYGQMCYGSILCGLCVRWGFKYKDKQFPPNETSIGKSMGKAVEWRPLGAICAKGNKMSLFHDDIHPSDIKQGELGDCWLLSAFACLANYPGAINRVFHNKTFNQYGKYKFKLFDSPTNKWVTVKIDDMIPCTADTGKPLFAKPSGDEAWVMLLEKMFAKFCGSYAALEGGDTLWGLEALTGDKVFKFMKDEGKSGWRKWTLKHKPEEGVRKAVLTSSGAAEVLEDEDFFKLILEQCKNGSVLECSMGAGSDSQNTDGIVHGHAYSLLKIVDKHGERLLRLRNPWGSFEWKGKWSDSSSDWEQSPKVAKACGWTKKEKEDGQDDGMFWMCWRDFLQYFKSVGFCYRTTGFQDLSLDADEESGCLGPCTGCTKGCCRFWLCCDGTKALCCAQATSEELNISTKVNPLSNSKPQRTGQPQRLQVLRLC